MAIQMNDDGTVSDSVTKENQKGYANYEMEQKRAQAEREAKDEATKSKYMNLIKSGMDMLSRPIKKAKGGTVSSASKRADGCAIKGKTRGRMV
jgi:hypothetical protein